MKWVVLTVLIRCLSITSTAIAVFIFPVAAQKHVLAHAYNTFKKYLTLKNKQLRRG
jgi:hypothetical protein